MRKLSITKTDCPKTKPMDEGALGFGAVFTDHMYLLNYDEGQGWHDARIVPYGPIAMDPASSVLHYSQTIFEGLKCYRRADGGVQLFRPADNFARMNRSAQRMCMPELDIQAVLADLLELLRLEEDWVPSTPGTSLYIRPTMVATDPRLGVHASHSYLFYIILSPVSAYYPTGLAPVSIRVEDALVRAVRGGVGQAKTGGNYASSILATARAAEQGFTQVLWLDGLERKYIEEVGTMNMFFRFRDALVTPPLGGSILPGITRDSVLALAREMGENVQERPITVDEVFDAADAGTLLEAFGTGTAAVISPVGMLQWGTRAARLSGGTIGPLTQRLYDTLTGIQYGALPDAHQWVVAYKYSADMHMDDLTRPAVDGIIAK